MKTSLWLVLGVATVGLACGVWFAASREAPPPDLGTTRAPAGEATPVASDGTAPAPAVETAPAPAFETTPAGAETGSLVGQPNPGFTINDLDGQPVSAGDFAGEVLLVNFWATWCGPCREEMPMLVELQSQYADRGFRVVGIALDEVQQARDFAAELGVNYTILVGGADVMAAGAAWGNRSGTLPYTVLVDREGIVRWSLLGVLEHDELVVQVTSLL